MASTGLLQAFDQGLSKALQGYTAERDRKDKRAMAEQELQSKRDVLAQQIAKEKFDQQKDRAGLLKDGFSPVAAGTTPKAGLITTQLGDETLAYDPTAKKLWNPNPLEKIQYEKAMQDLRLAQEKDTPEGKYAAAPAEVKGKVGNITNALSSLTNLESAYEQGQRPQYVDSNTALIGRFISDNDFTSAQRLMNEEVGRLQSGGAITVGELKGFRDLDPRAGDSEALQRSKMQQKRAWLENKLAAFGIKKEDVGRLGFNEQAMGLLRPPKEQAGPQLAGAGLITPPKASSEDAAALKWANANPKDPRAAAIKARLGAK